MNTPRLFACVAAVAISLLACASTGYAKSSGSISLSESVSTSATQWTPKPSLVIVGSEKFELPHHLGLAIGFGLSIPEAGEPVPAVRIGTSLSIDLSHLNKRAPSIAGSLYYQYAPATGTSSFLFSIPVCFKLPRSFSVVVAPGMGVTTARAVSISTATGIVYKF